MPRPPTPPIKREEEQEVAKDANDGDLERRPRKSALKKQKQRYWGQARASPSRPRKVSFWDEGRGKGKAKAGKDKGKGGKAKGKGKAKDKGGKKGGKKDGAARRPAGK